ncbi:hypothetical protein N9850_08885 [Granulosicoccus sp.]|nr:hypothetical protein [Granulosicoccus sp.]MDB4223876.1 hypothetical protein [Granulosicoccus sp.]
MKFADLDWYRRDGSQATAHAEANIAELENALEGLLLLKQNDRSYD